MRRYPIHDDFKRYARLVPPITRQTLPLLRAAQHLLPLPSPKKAGVSLHRVMIRQGVYSIEAQLIEPMKHSDPLPALVYFHGGGFVLEAAPYHYALAMMFCSPYAMQGLVRPLSSGAAAPVSIAGGRVFRCLSVDIATCEDTGDQGGNDRGRR